MKQKCLGGVNNMKKLQMEIPLILPDIPDEKDQCLDRLIQQLQGKDGLEKVHVAAANDNGVSQLCLHYDPEIISIGRIQQLAEQTGAELTRKFGHMLTEVDGIRHIRHARTIGRNLRDKKGIVEASVSGFGMVRLEFDTQITDEAEILQALRNEGLVIPDTQVHPKRIFTQADKPK